MTSSAAVEAALDEFDRLGREAFLSKYGFGRSHKYFVRRDGKEYDSKAIVGAAYGFEHPDSGPMARTDFSGGDHGAKAKLEQLGFEVVERRAAVPHDAPSLFEALDAALRAQSERDREQWSAELQEAVGRTLPAAIQARVDPAFSVKGSTGFGRQAEIPWVSVLPPGIEGASEGRYVVYLFSADGSRVFLSLSQAVTGQPKRALAALAETLREDAGDQPALLDRIDLGASGELGEKYSLATAYAREYRRDSLPSDEELESDLGRFLDMLDDVIERGEARAPESSWIFQANPTRYRIDDGLRELPQIEWIVRHHEKRVRKGDFVYIWRSGNQAGVVATGRVATGPTLAAADPAEAPYWLQPDDSTEVLPRVKVSIEQVLDQPLLRADLRNDLVLQNLEIIRIPRGTVYAVKPDEDARLRELLGERPVPYTVAMDAYVEASLEAILEAVQAAGMTIDERTLRRYHISLKTRGFVVLSGISGTGKTWLAEEYANAVGARTLVVPVAPNWTTNEDLLGYLNPLDQTYHDTAFSLFLRAAAEQFETAERDGLESEPFHLILDEMNLARVEYYFAKFLSAMELRSRSEDAFIELSPGDRVALTPNLKFIGTVNVDETTHGFADKVYDRSQLIELTIDREQVLLHLGERDFAPVLVEVWSIMRDVAPFAFRVLDEVTTYVTEAARLGVSWEEALDEQLLQKVLPKVKGTDLRVGGALRDFVDLTVDRFPLSHEKAETMLRAFNEHGFTSYF